MNIRFTLRVTLLRHYRSNVLQRGSGDGDRRKRDTLDRITDVGQHYERWSRF